MMTRASFITRDNLVDILECIGDHNLAGKLSNGPVYVAEKIMQKAVNGLLWIQKGYARLNFLKHGKKPNPRSKLV